MTASWSFTTETVRSEDQRTQRFLIGMRAREARVPPTEKVTWWTKTKMRTGLETKSENESAKEGEEDEVGTLLGRSVGRLLYGVS